MTAVGHCQKILTAGELSDQACHHISILHGGKYVWSKGAGGDFKKIFVRFKVGVAC